MNVISGMYPAYSTPSYSCNGVKIDIHNPQAGLPMPTQPIVPVVPVNNNNVSGTNVGGVYNYPQGSVYAQNPMAYPIPYIASPRVQAPVTSISVILH